MKGPTGSALRRGDWHVWIDTGGTFTDCLARDPSGALHRAKVLSTGALRGTVLERIDACTLRVDADWLTSGAGVNGFAFHLLGAGRAASHVERLEHVNSLLRLSGPVESVSAGSGFELRSTESAPILAARLVTGTHPDQPLPPLRMRLATTRGTNALLERQGELPVLFITRGFRDLLRIGTQQRPDLFALRIEKPTPLFRSVVEVPERLSAVGDVLQPLELEPLRGVLPRLRSAGASTAAIALLHAHRNPLHEEQLEQLLREFGFAHVSRSSGLAPFIGLLNRAQTTVVDAYLAPVIADYLAAVAVALEHGSADPPAPPSSRHAARRGSNAAAGGEDVAAESGAAAVTPAAGAQLLVMTSAGGLVPAARFAAKDSLLSGPAGGVVGAAVAGRQAGLARVIAFDMGGTSTDVARIDDDFDYTWEHSVGDARLVAPALAIESVAAGGGSICALRADGLRVGPQSAGAEPGPACYGAGGPLTLTDVNLLLGRLDPARFGIPVVPDAARARADELRHAVAGSSGEPTPTEPLLAGLLALADEAMADAIRRISLRKGYDPAEYALVAFGGAGPQHACGVASRLGIGTVLVPRDAGLLSALGIGHAVIERFAERQVLQELERVEPRIEALIAELAREAAAEVEAEGVTPEQIEVRRRILRLRYVGQEAALEVEWPCGPSLADAFENRYREVFGHTPEARTIELESVRIVASSTAEEGDIRTPGARLPTLAESGARHAMWSATAGGTGGSGEWRHVESHDRDALAPGARVSGPALIWEEHSTTVLEEGWEATVDDSGALVLRWAAAGEGATTVTMPDVVAGSTSGDGVAGEGGGGNGEGKGSGKGRGRGRGKGKRGTGQAQGQGDIQSAIHNSQSAIGGEVGAVREELFIHRFESLVAEMGEQLRRTALSVNVRERLDFSCALLDANGELVANAPHIPVHLGALGLCVREVARVLRLEAGDVAVTNHPAFGGSHLPDITVIAPVHDASGTLLGYVANRAHHAEIGGSRPGSMPPAARNLAEEGVVLPPSYLLRAGNARWSELRALLEAGATSSRAVEDNLADLRAQVAAAHRGVRLLRSLAESAGTDAVALHMRALTRRAEARLRAALRQLPDGEHGAVERLDDGSPLAVTIQIQGDTASFDFAGSAPQHPGNLNATPAIVRSVVLYVLRLLIGEPLPLNEGLLRPIELRVPAGILNPDFPADPRAAPAVVGGNVETSQRLVDTLLRALGLAACSQGTMNNVLFGNERFGYYETVCGGAGAGPTWAGADAVHTHMTNTRITDAEVLEHRFPVRVERFAIRRGSGGAGRWRGGDGAERELRFLEPMTLSVLSQHRAEVPYGMRGGAPGATGKQRVIRASGEVLELGPIDGCQVAAGDRLRLETPGGGAWGEASPQWAGDQP